MTVDEVNRLIPELTLIVQRLHTLRREIVSRANELERLGFDPASGSRRDVPPAIQERWRLLDVAVTDFEAAVERVGALGGVLQDLELGLVDFHHVLDGREVLLCWQLGEDEVAHFHSMEAGFSGRKLLPGARPMLLN